MRTERVTAEGYIDDRTAAEVVDDLTEAIFLVLDADRATTAHACERGEIARRAAEQACRALLADES